MPLQGSHSLARLLCGLFFVLAFLAQAETQSSKGFIAMMIGFQVVMMVKSASAMIQGKEVGGREGGEVSGSDVGGDTVAKDSGFGGGGRGGGRGGQGGRGGRGGGRGRGVGRGGHEGP